MEWALSPRALPAPAGRRDGAGGEQPLCRSCPAAYGGGNAIETTRARIDGKRLPQTAQKCWDKRQSPSHPPTLDPTQPPELSAVTSVCS